MGWEGTSSRAKSLTAIEKCIMLEAGKINKEFQDETNLVDRIERLSGIFENNWMKDLTVSAFQQDIEELCEMSLAKLADAREQLRL